MLATFLSNLVTTASACFSRPYFLPKSLIELCIFFKLVKSKKFAFIPTPSKTGFNSYSSVVTDNTSEGFNDFTFSISGLIGFPTSGKPLYRFGKVLELVGTPTKSTSNASIISVTATVVATTCSLLSLFTCFADSFFGDEHPAIPINKMIAISTLAIFFTLNHHSFPYNMKQVLMHANMHQDSKNYNLPALYLRTSKASEPSSNTMYKPSCAVSAVFEFFSFFESFFVSSFFF